MTIFPEIQEFLYANSCAGGLRHCDPDDAGYDAENKMCRVKQHS